MIAACMTHQLIWDAVERHQFLEDSGCRTVYADSGTLDSGTRLEISEADRPPVGSYLPL
jgi:hypothetical protein